LWYGNIWNLFLMYSFFIGCHLQEMSIEQLNYLITIHQMAISNIIEEKVMWKEGRMKAKGGEAKGEGGRGRGGEGEE
jgi:hypothetical protein